MSQPEDCPQTEYLSTYVSTYLSMLYFLWGQEEIVINHEDFSAVTVGSQLKAHELCSTFSHALTHALIESLSV